MQESAVEKKPSFNIVAFLLKGKSTERFISGLIIIAEFIFLSLFIPFEQRWTISFFAIAIVLFIPLYFVIIGQCRKFVERL